MKFPWFDQTTAEAIQERTLKLLDEIDLNELFPELNDPARDYRDPGLSAQARYSKNGECDGN